MAESAAPILPSRGLRETLAFDERLGFENLGAPPERWNYLVIGRGESACASGTTLTSTP